MNIEYTFLTDKFYNDYQHDLYPQIEIKKDRPYAHIHVNAFGLLFGLPLRSHIDHPHAFFTNKKEKCGVDYSKAVVITSEDYIDRTRKAFIRPDEYKKLVGKDFRIRKQFESYIELYKRAKIDDTVPHREKISKYSSLQYFEESILKDTLKDSN